MKRGAARKLHKQVEKHGPLEVGRDSLADWTGFITTTPLGRSKMADDLAEAGFLTEPAVTDLPRHQMTLLLGTPLSPPGEGAEGFRVKSRGEVKNGAKAEKKNENAEWDARIETEILQNLTKAAASTHMPTQERALSSALDAARSHDGPFNKRWETWANSRIARMQSSGDIARGEFLGHVAHVMLFTDRIVFVEDGELFVQEVDEHLNASVETAGDITKRPTLTRMAIGSVLPGTALIPGLAFQKKSDNRQLFFVLEHPSWSKIVELEPDAIAVAQALKVRINQSAAGMRHSKSEAGPSQAGAAASPTGETATLDYLQELQRLGDLRDSGVLTEEEFSAQKARVLGAAGD